MKPIEEMMATAARCAQAADYADRNNNPLSAHIFAAAGELWPITAALCERLEAQTAAQLATNEALGRIAVILQMMVPPVVIATPFFPQNTTQPPAMSQTWIGMQHVPGCKCHECTQSTISTSARPVA